MRTLLLAVLLALTPTVGWAGAWSNGCQFTGGTVTGTVGTPTNTSARISNNDVGCYRFNNADSTHNSPRIQVTAESAVITFDPQLDAVVTVATTALVVPRLCPIDGPIDTANPSFSCISIGGANSSSSLSGVEGPAATQNASIRVGPGTYYFQITGACLAGDTCQVSVKGEGGQ